MNGTETTTKSKNKPKAQEVWYVKFPFEEDESKYKVRPVIVLNDPEDSNVEVACLSVKVTSKPKREDDIGDTVILKWKEANLKKPSVARVSKTMSIPISQFERKVGQADDEDFINILQKFVEIFDI